jgi:hypothetical protein
MKCSLPKYLVVKILLVLLGILGLVSSVQGTTTIDPVNTYSYGANFGWMNWRGDTNNGAVIGEYVCSGNIYCANIGWINLGSGSPANGIQYQNNSATDFGVNQDGLGNLQGDAWAANVGWIVFETNGAPKVNLLTGVLSGYVWSANCGWISLSNAVAAVQTDTIQQGALAPNGLPIAWLLSNFGTTNVDANADPDHDGMNNLQEYLAGTDPNNAASVLRITSITRGTLDANYTTVAWLAVPTRFYLLQERPSLGAGAWADYLNVQTLGWNNTAFDDFNVTNEFFRVEAYRPLIP